MTGEDKVYKIALALCDGLERRSLNRLVHGFGSAAQVWKGSVGSWLKIVKLRPGTLQALSQWREQKDPWKLVSELNGEGVAALTVDDDAYPRQLLAWDKDAPTVLFVKGNTGLLSAAPLVSIVGTRRASAYGLEAARWVAEGLVHAGSTIVSGMALGIDAESHRAALEVGGRTVAVLGCGVNVCYPPGNRQLYSDIVAKGAIVSEYPPNAVVAKHHFIERNRIIAALSDTLVVVQAGEKSGALTTVDAALSIGRDVYVVPGPITSKLYRGSNRLLKDGAQILLDPQDLAFNLGLQTSRSAPTSVSSIPARWRDLLEVLDETQSVADLAGQTGLSLSQVYVALLELEMDGWVRRLPGGYYERAENLFS